MDAQKTKYAFETYRGTQEDLICAADELLHKTDYEKDFVEMLENLRTLSDI